MAIADVDIKLDCRLDVSSIYRGGTEEKSNLSRTVEIYQNGNFISIIPGGVIGSIHSNNEEDIYFKNNSNARKWDLTRIVLLDNLKITSQITIDRNAGTIYLYQDFQEGRVITSAHGTCSKIDTTRKKF